MVNKTLVTTGLTINSTYIESIESGGYCRIGDFVLVQIRIKRYSSTTEIPASTTIVTGFPPTKDVAVYLTESGNNGTIVYIDTSGNMKLQNLATGAGALFFSGMYLAST